MIVVGNPEQKTLIQRVSELERKLAEQERKISALEAIVGAQSQLQTSAFPLPNISIGGAGQVQN